jgi:glutathione synthase
VSRLSHSPEFIHQALAEHAKSDNFVKQLLEISKYYHSESNKWKQDVYLGILRMDYMIEKDEHKIKMIEFNTAASSFGVLFDLTHSLHRYLFTKYKDVIKKPAENIMERNNFKEKAAEAFKQAHLQYLKHDYSGIEEGDTEESKGKCLEERNEVGILFVVQETERNVFDQRPLEYELMKHDITCLRMTFLEIYHNSSLTQNGQLKVY